MVEDRTEIELVEKYLCENYKVSSDGDSDNPYCYSKLTTINNVDRFLDIKINNQTIQIYAHIVEHDAVGLPFGSPTKLKNYHYSYLQTYPHIKRGEPDKYGYYQRSTAKEVIRYIESLRNEIWLEEYREKRLKGLLG